MGRLRTDRLDLSLEEVDVVQLVEDVISQLRTEIARSRSDVSLNANSRSVVRADPLRLAQVVTNLLSNALKFGEGKPVQITVDEREGRCTIAVTDRGTGIDAESVALIFEPFERRVSDRHYGGLGLGLHIVHSLVAAMGGTIRVSSALGQGSTFTVELPAAAS